MEIQLIFYIFNNNSGRILGDFGVNYQGYALFLN